jgi:Rrf2 family protein
MRLVEGVEWALHCCTVLALVPPGRTLPATRLAEFHEVPPAYLAKHLQSLSRAGIVESVPGPRGGYRLARPPADVTVLDVVEAIEGDEAAFRCTEIRQNGPAGQPPECYPRPCGIAQTMWSAERAWRTVLRDRTVADLVGLAASEATPAALETAVTWMSESARS